MQIFPPKFVSSACIKHFSPHFSGFHPIVTMTNVRTGNCSRGVVTGGAGRSLLCGGADSTSAGTGTAVKGNHPSKVVAEGSGGSLHASPRSQSEDAFTSTSSFLKEVERGARNEVQVWRHSDPIVAPNLEHCWTGCSCKTELSLSTKRVKIWVLWMSACYCVSQKFSLCFPAAGRGVLPSILETEYRFFRIILKRERVWRVPLVTVTNQRVLCILL